MNFTVKSQCYHAKRIDEASSSSAYFDATPKVMYRRYYLEVLDTLIGEIERHFESPSFAFYAKMESVLEKSAVGKEIVMEDVKDIVQHFKEDLSC